MSRTYHVRISRLMSGRQPLVLLSNQHIEYSFIKKLKQLVQTSQHIRHQSLKKNLFSVLCGSNVSLTNVCNDKTACHQVYRRLLRRFEYGISLVQFCRIHAEFQLNDVPDFPFWFTPGQFTGSIVLSKDGSHVRHFHLYVPSDR